MMPSALAARISSPDSTERAQPAKCKLSISEIAINEKIPILILNNNIAAATEPVQKARHSLPG